MIKLTHSLPNYELWIDYDEIVVMERYNRPKSIIIQSTDDKPDVTALVLKSGKIMSCKETPSEIHALRFPVPRFINSKLEEEQK